MDVRVSKMVPTLIVTAAVSYCCWPHWVGTATGAVKGRAAMPEIAATVLKPPPPPDPPRNLFAPDGIASVSETPKLKPAAKAVAPVHEDPAKLLNGLSLKAIWVRGGRRLALINGRLYAPGDALETGTRAGHPEGKQ